MCVRTPGVCAVTPGCASAGESRRHCGARREKKKNTPIDAAFHFPTHPQRPERLVVRPRRQDDFGRDGDGRADGDQAEAGGGGGRVDGRWGHGELFSSFSTQL
jgi:hypothetical protein